MKLDKIRIVLRVNHFQTIHFLGFYSGVGLGFVQSNGQFFPPVFDEKNLPCAAVGLVENRQRGFRTKT